MWRSLLAVVLASSLSASTAEAQLWSQLPDFDRNLIISADGYTQYGWLGRNDFTLASSASIGTIRFWGVDHAAATSVDWAIYADAAGSKGSLLGSGTAAALTTTNLGAWPTESPWIQFANEFDVGGLSLGPGTFWLELSRMSPGMNHTWSTTASVVGYTAVHSAPGEANWGRDFAFEVYGTSEVPEPGTFSLVAIGVGLLGLRSATRRRKS